MRQKDLALILVMSSTCLLCGCATMSDARVRKGESARKAVIEAPQTASINQQELRDIHYGIGALQNEIINLKKEVNELENRVSDLEKEHEPQPKFLPDR